MSSTALVLYTGDDNKSACGTTVPTEISVQLVGLQNQGATCYMNSLLQSLFMTPEFRMALYHWEYDSENDGKESESIPLQLQKLFGLLQLSKKRAASTVDLTTSFGWGGSEIYQQQDAQELSRILFDVLEDALKETPQRNIINELYAGEMIDYVKCVDVDYESERKDSFLDLSLAIRSYDQSAAPMRSVQECIELYLRPEILDGDNKYFAAEPVNKKVDAIKGLKFTKLPKILSIQLKRFVFDFSGENIVQKKLNDEVKFPFILDMNKYVSHSKYKGTTGATGGTGYSSGDGSGKTETVAEGDASLANVKEDCSDTTLAAHAIENSFEKFLQDQISKLKTKRVDSMQCLAGTSNDNDVLVEGTKALESAVAVWEDDRLNGSQEILEQCPTVVAEDISPSSDGVEENAVKETEETEKPLEECMVMLGSEVDVQALLQTRGEWIYELYAVLVHSGVCGGGHYYAYIKDLDTKKWYNFNDSNVSEITEDVVKEAWGGYVTSPAYPSTYMSMYGGASAGQKTLSTSNAYMLLYRRISKVDPTTAESSSVASLFPDASLIPKYVVDIVEREEAARVAQELALEEERNKLRLQVYFNKDVKTIYSTKDCLYEDFLKVLCNEFDVASAWGSSAVGKGVENVVGSSGGASSDSAEVAVPKVSDTPDVSRDIPPGQDNITAPLSDIGAAAEANQINLSLLRLRKYTVYCQQRTNAYTYEEYKNCTLASMSVANYGAFIIETRESTNIPWEVYHAEGITLQLVGYDHEKNVFVEPVSQRFPVTATLGDLRMHIAQQVSYDYSEVRLMRLLCGGGMMTSFTSNHTTYDMDCDHKKIKGDMHWYEGIVLHYEKAMDNTSASAAAELYVAQLNNLTLHVNRPPATLHTNAIVVDRRISVLEFRQQLAKELDLEVDSFRIYMGSYITPSNELKNLTASVHSHSVSAGCLLTLTSVGDMPLNHFSINLYLHTAVYPVGVCNKPVTGVDVMDSSVVSSTLPVDGGDVNVQKICAEENPSFSVAALNASPAATTITPSSGVISIGDYEFDDDDDVPPLIPADELGPSYEAVTAVAGNTCSPNSTSDDVWGDDRPGEPKGAGGMGDRKEHLEDLSCFMPSTTTTIASPITGGVTANLCASSSIDVQTPPDVEFADLTVPSSMTESEYERLSSASELTCPDDATLGELRLRVANYLKSKQLLPQEASSRCIRLRDRVGLQASRILKEDSKSLVDNKFYISSSKDLVVEILPSEEDLLLYDEDSVVIVLKYWDRSTRMVGNAIELCVSASMEICEVADLLCKLVNIAPGHVRVMSLDNSGSMIKVSKLQYHTPHYMTHWIDPTNDHKRLRDIGWYMKDGFMFLFQDLSIPLRALTEREQLSLESVFGYVVGGAEDECNGEMYLNEDSPIPTAVPVDSSKPEYYGSAFPDVGMYPMPAWGGHSGGYVGSEAYSNSSSTSGTTSSYPPGGTNVANPVTGPTVRPYMPMPRRQEQGIRIKTRTDRAREQEEQKRQQVASSSVEGTGDNNDSPTSPPSPAMATVNGHVTAGYDDPEYSDAASIALFSGLD